MDYFNMNTMGPGPLNGERKTSGIEQYRQERKPGTVPAIPLNRMARGILKFKCRQEEKITCPE
jgi:hypothetical protein